MGMSQYWDLVLAPVVDALQPDQVVQIGCGGGRTTELLLGSGHGKPPKVVAIDKWLEFDPQELQKKYDSRFVFHRSLALNALPQLEAMDLVIMDGDPNWYTVHHALAQMERATRAKDRPFPCVVVHNIGWPYARRDGYQDPGVIPDAFRQPSKKLGVAPGNPELVEQGLYPQRYHAVYETDQRNGVLTAVESFIEGSQLKLEWVPILFRSGVGLLFSRDLSERCPGFAAWARSVTLPAAVNHLLETAEQERSALCLEVSRAQANLTRLGKERDELAGEGATLRRDMESRLAAHQADRQGLRRQIDEARAAAEEALSSHRRVLADLENRCLEAESQGRSLGRRLQEASEQLEEKELNLDRLRAELQLAEKGTALSRKLERQLTETRTELAKLRTAIAAQAKDNRLLTGWMDGMSRGMERHFKSWSWRLGAGLVGVARRMLRRREVPIQSLQVTRIAREYLEWRSRRGAPRY